MQSHEVSYIYTIQHQSFIAKTMPETSPINENFETLGRRLYKRHVVKIEALCKPNNLAPFKCEIQDFCEGGLLLKPDSASTLISKLKDLSNQKAQVIFNARNKTEIQRFKLNLVIARVSDRGIGATFEDNPPDPLILEALFSFLNTTKYDNNKTYSFHSNSNEDSTNINNRCIDIVRNSFGQIINEFHNNVEHELSKAAVNAPNDIAGNSLMDAIIDLKKNRANLEKLFHSSIPKEFTQNPKQASITDEGIKNESSHGDLRLLDPSEFEDWLDVSEMVNHTRSFFKDELSELTNKFIAVTNVSADDSPTPIEPDFICEQFRDGIKNYHFVTHVRKEVYKVFGTALHSNLNKMYTPLIELMQDVHPATISEQTIQCGESHSISKEDQVDNTIKSSESLIAETDNKALDQNNLSNTQDSPQFSQKNHPVKGMSEVLVPNVMTPQPFVESDVDKQKPSTTLAPRNVDIAMSRPYPGDSKKQTKSIDHHFTKFTRKLVELESLLDQRTTRTKTFDHSIKRTSDSTAKTEFSGFLPEQVFSAVYLLTKNRSENKNLTENGQTLEAEVLEVLTSGQLTNNTLDTDNQSEISIVGKFIDFVNAETYESPSMTEVMGKIQIPLVKLAFTDNQFLDSKDHPAKRILNLLDRISVTTGKNGNISDPETQNTIKKIVRLFSYDTEQTQESYKEIVNDLKEIVIPIEKRKLQNIQRVQENCEAGTRILQSKRQVENLVNARIANKKVPRLVVELLDAGWKHLIILGFIKNGSDNGLGHTAIQVIDALLNLLGTEAETNQSTNNQGQQLIDYIEFFLPSVGVDVQKRAQIMRELTACLVGQGYPQVKKSPEMIFINRTESEKSSKHIDVAPKLAIWLEKAKQIKVSDWLLVHFSDQRLEPVNLVWSDNETSQYVFTNRQGLKSLTLSTTKLAELLRKGLAQQIENPDSPLTDRVTNRMLQEMHEKLIIHATHDAQTGLINRKEFVKRLERELVEAKKYNSNHMVFYYEVDQIRLISNSCTSDGLARLLEEIVSRLNSDLGEEYILSRLGDETFGYLIKNVTESDAMVLAEKLRTSVTNFEFKWEGKIYPLNVSIGLARFGYQSENVPAVMNRADTACLTAKEAGSNQIRAYHENDQQYRYMEDVSEWAGQISTILSEKRIVLTCQLISPVCKEKSSHSHYEVLIAVKDEQGQITSPASFIASAEHCNRMPDIDQYVIEHIMRWIINNPKEFDKIGGFAINLSGQSINSEIFQTFLKKELLNRDIPHEKIIFEITETAAVQNLDYAQNFIYLVKKYGCKFALDDFGSGFSSYAYLKYLDVDYLKIDGVFVRDLATSKSDFAMVKSMNEIGQSLGMETIAEYVENDNILEKLQNLGVNYAQGFGVHKPELLSVLTRSLLH